MYVIGISETHCDSGCVLLVDGQVKLAVNEERFSRIKRHRGFPYKSIEWILAESGLKLSEIDVFAIAKMGVTQDIQPYIRSLKRHYQHAEPDAGLIPLAIDKTVWFGLMVPYCYRATSILNYEISRWTQKNKIPQDRIQRVAHHPAHAYSAYFSSGYESALIVTMDGQGLGVSATISEGQGIDIKEINSVLLPNSVGQFYTLVTLTCGFKPNRHEGKITGLAAYGKYIPELQRFVDSLLEFKNGTIIGNAIYGHFFQTQTMLKRYGRENLSYAFQRRLEEIVIEYINHYYESRRHLKNVVLCGGVFANVQLNQRIRHIKGVENIFIYPHMGDGGLGLGAAIMVEPTKKMGKLQHVYLGPRYTDQQIQAALRKYRLEFTQPRNLAGKLATLLHDGKVIGRFDGRMEFGPRALGNRSILVNPRDITTNFWLNKKLHRSEFMPFAPVTLKEEANKCYYDLAGSEHASEFMTMTYDCTSFMKTNAPAVVHVNGTARPQIISRNTNPIYYDILEEYYKLASVPSLINTSFNMHEEPIVCTPEDAIRCAQKGELDALSIGPYLVTNI